jgi:pimeloyl-ACP methyl ester carboxylesterase
MLRPAQCATVVIVIAATLAGCAPLLAANPRYAINSGRAPQHNVSNTPPPSGPPAVAAPKNDLAWSDCTTKVFGDAAVTPPAGVMLECANYDADLDPINGATGTLSIGVVRARSPQTPPDAGPLVFTTGTDLASSLQLPVWLSRGGADMLRAHPIVAVDRRGLGMSNAVDCRSPADRQKMQDQAQFEGGDDPVANLVAISQTATTACTDAIGEPAYDNAHAAEDLERLRSTWDVPALALIGVGDGTQIALAYAGAHPTKVARLILDSPISPGINAEGAAEERVKAQQAALDAFASQCAAAPNCPLGPDPKSAVSALLAAAAAGRGPGRFSAAAVVDAITAALAYPHGDRVAAMNGLASALAAAQSGDTNQLANLINQAQSVQGSDGQFVDECSDALNRPTPDRIRELVVGWGKLYPQFGKVGALSMVQCVNWPAASAPPDPKNLKVNVVLMGAPFDPLAGADGVAAASATVINAGVASKRVMWQGVGHGVTVFSQCALPPLVGYLDSGNLPATDTFCPA